MKKITLFFKKYLKWMLLVLLVILFLEIAENIFQNEIDTFDCQMYQGISKFMGDHLTIGMKIITTMGSAIPIILISVLSFLFLKNKKYGKYITINLMIIFLLNQTMKFLFQRPRPIENRMVQEFGYSFPSGHSMVSMAFYGFLIYLVYKKINKPIIKWGSIIVLTLLILGIGISRIYLGAHYASDVVGGFVFSISYLILYTSLVKDNLFEMEKE